MLRRPPVPTGAGACCGATVTVGSSVTRKVALMAEWSHRRLSKEEVIRINLTRPPPYKVGERSFWCGYCGDLIDPDDEDDIDHHEWAHPYLSKEEWDGTATEEST